MASATVTMQMSGTANYATNFANGSGVGGSTLVWGIVIDTSGNGFAGTAATPYMPGFNYAGNSANPYVLSTFGGGVSDDVLVLSTNLMNITTNATDSGSIGLNRITNITSLSYTSGVGVSAGDAYRIIWFDKTALSGASATGTKYGMFEIASTPITVASGTTIAGNTLGADPGTYNYSSAWAGADSLKTMSFTLGEAVPETSTSLLGALGALALLRRRRN